jgi:hypothetical protein
MPWSGSRQTFDAHSACDSTIGHSRRAALRCRGVEQDRVEHRAEDVVLALVEGAVADPHGSRARVAGEVVAVDSVRSRRPSIPYMICSEPSSVGSTSATNCMNSSASQSRLSQWRPAA